MRTLLSSLCVALIAIIMSANVAEAQIRMPAPSPTSKIVQNIGLTEVSVVYSRPSKRGRAIFGELVPFDAVWRTGANASTKITFSTDVQIEGKDLAAGTYALYTIPMDSKWVIIFSKNTELWGSMGYKSDDDALRVEVPSRKVNMSYETFTMAFSDLADNQSMKLNIMWDNVMAAFTISTDPDPQVMADIKKNVIDATDVKPNTYFAAANYYYSNDKDIDQAYTWVKMANKANPAYWMLHLQAKIEAKLGKKEMAVATATKSMVMAEKENNPDYVKLNKDLIDSLK